MALKGPRYEFLTDVTYFMNQVAVRGGVVGQVTAGSGAAYDQAAAAVAYVANSSGVRPVGLLLGDVVNLDLTRQHINWHKNETQIGGKVPLMKRGFVVTNNITGTPGNGDTAYLTSSGNVYPVAINVTNTNVAANPRVGYFGSTLDEDGYAKLFVEL